MSRYLGLSLSTTSGGGDRLVFDLPAAAGDSRPVLITNRSKAQPLPAVYLASGVFRTSSPLLRERGRAMIKYLRSIGFQQIFTQPLLGRGEGEGSAKGRGEASSSDQDLDRYFMDDLTIFSNTTNDNDHAMSTTQSIDVASLDPEQNAYVDLLIARRATCFVPAHKKSSFSYMAQRLNEIEREQFGTDIQPPHRDHMSWGM